GRSARNLESNSRPTNEAESCFGSTHVRRACSPAATISRANSVVGTPQIGKTGDIPVALKNCSRYRRIYSRKRSPNAKPLIPSDFAFSTTSCIAASYLVLLHGLGIGTFHNGSPAASA